MTNPVQAHKLVFKTAVALAESVFEEAMSRDNALYRQIRASRPGKSVKFLRRVFVSALAPRLLGDARATLAAMLATPIDEALKLEIADALTLDNAIPVDRDNRQRLTRH